MGQEIPDACPHLDYFLRSRAGAIIAAAAAETIPELKARIAKSFNSVYRVGVEERPNRYSKGRRGLSITNDLV